MPTTPHLERNSALDVGTRPNQSQEMDIGQKRRMAAAGGFWLDRNGCPYNRTLMTAVSMSTTKSVVAITALSACSGLSCLIDPCSTMPLAF